MSGKMKNKDLYMRGFYIPGLDHLMYLENLRQQFDLGILSTLPQSKVRI